MSSIQTRDEPAGTTGRNFVASFAIGVGDTGWLNRSVEQITSLFERQAEGDRTGICTARDADAASA